ncbi:MAG: N-acetyltransferase family protein [Pseudomonadota bacterium]
MGSPDVQIRHAEPGDLARIVEIYNHYIVNTHFTFAIEPFAVGGRTQWFTQFSENGRYRLLVAVVDSEVVGYSCSTPFKSRAAYSTSVETSVYLHREAGGRGIGTQLYSALLQGLIDDPDIHRAYGGVGLPNDASIALHEKLGYETVGTYNEVGYKFDQYWDVRWYQRDMTVKL